MPIRKPDLLSVLAAAGISLPALAAAQSPSLLVPSRPDSVTYAEPAPLVRPGQPAAAPDTARLSRRARAAEQYQLGRAFETQSSPVSAITAYRNAVQLDPEIRDAHYRMGRLYVARDRWGEAAAEYARELAVNPTHHDAAVGMGLALAHVGDSARAVPHMEELSRRFPRDPEVWQALGFAYATAGRAHQAERALRRTLELKPDAGTAWRDLGVVLAQSSKLRDARGAYRRAASLLPADAGVWVNLGNLEAREARYDSAYAAYHQAEARDSTLAYAYAGQVRALGALGRDREAAEVYRRWTRNVPDDEGVRLDAIQAWARLGRHDVAVELAREGVRVAPTSGSAHSALGIALSSDGQWEAALGSLRKAETLYRRAGQRQGVRDYIASLRARAPASTRAIFAADSLAHPAPADSAGGAK